MPEHDLCRRSERAPEAPWHSGCGLFARPPDELPTGESAEDYGQMNEADLQQILDIVDILVSRMVAAN